MSLAFLSFGPFRSGFIILWIYLILENIIQKHSLFKGSVLETHFTKAMLYSIHPFAFEFTSIFPYHFPLALALVLVIFSFVNIPTYPLEGSGSVLHVV